MTFFW